MRQFKTNLNVTFVSGFYSHAVVRDSGVFTGWASTPGPTSLDQKKNQKNYPASTQHSII